MKRHIAFVEDDTVVRENYSEALEREGFSVSAYKNRSEAEAAFSDKLPELAILDIQLEDERDGGFTLCKFLRKRSDTIPIIFLTALDKDMDRVSGMRLGAIDYMLKDTTTLDFLPVRIKALFDWLDKIKKPSLEESDIVCGPLTLNGESNEVFWNDVPVHLPLAEFWVLQSLVKRPGNLKSHEQLRQAGNITSYQPNAIVATVKRIRGKFKEIDPDFDCIKTEYGMGYRWVK